MAALIATARSRTGATTTGRAVAATDTISSTILGQVGAILEIINGNASADAITISDAGSSPSGTPAVSYAASVAAGASMAFFIDRRQADSNGIVTITHGTVPTVTYKLYPVG